MNRKSVRTYSGKRSPLGSNANTKNTNNNKVEETSNMNLKADGKSPRRSLRNKTEDQLKENTESTKLKAKRVLKMDTSQTKESNEDPKQKNHCQICSKEFKTITGLKNHILKCSKDKPPEAKIVEDQISISGQIDSDQVEEEMFKLHSTETGNVIALAECHCCGEDLETAHTVGDHVCQLCQKKFKLKISLDRHMSIIHNQREVFECSICGVKFNDKKELARHIFKHAEEQVAPRSCYCCGEDVASAHKSGPHSCSLCKKLFKLKSSLDRHLKVVHGGGSHQCPQCNARCPDRGTLARHMYTHTGLKPYSCPVCNQEFSRKYHLVRHNMQTGCDGKEKPVHPCQVCGREFNRKDNLREHLRAHAGQTKRKKMFTCEMCGEQFCGTQLLQLHKKTKHIGDKQYGCDFCPKRFHSSGAMKKHRRTHTGERPFECSFCGKKFAAKETLNRHVRIHTGDKPHCCQYCGKRFIQSSQLRSHLFYHTGQSVLQPTEVFVCDECGKTFNRRARLNEHTKYVHMGAKPFECDHCSKKFIRKEDLNRHIIIHTGQKTHKCPICSKSFAMKSSLKVHLLTHTKEPPRSCDECGRAFIRQDCLLRHMRHKHRDMLDEIRSETEKKKLQQQLLQVAAEASLVEGLEEKGELDETGLTEAVSELLTLLVDEATLLGLGWPQAGVETLLESVIKRCGHEPASDSTPSHDRLRHNVKLLFTVVIDDSAVKALLNNQTIDQVILHVLHLAKS